MQKKKIDTPQLIINSFIGSLLTSILAFYILKVGVIFIATSAMGLVVFFGPFGYYIFMIIQAILIILIVGTILRLCKVYKPYLTALTVVSITLFVHYFLQMLLPVTHLSEVLAFVVSFCLFMYVIYLFSQRVKK